MKRLRKRREWLIAPLLTEADVTKTLVTLSKFWYAIAVLTFLLRTISVLIGSVSYEFVVDVGICALGGYFLPKRKSRSFSVFLLSYAIFVFVLKFGARFGMWEGTSQNIILPILALLIGYRGVHATFVYHSLLKSQTVWENVLIVWSITIGAIMASCFVALTSLLFLEACNLYLSEEQMANYLSGFILIVCAFCFALLTKRYNFVTFSLTPPNDGMEN